MHSFSDFFLILFILGGITSIIQGNMSQGISLCGCWIVCKVLSTKYIDEKIGVDKSDRLKVYVILFTVFINIFILQNYLETQPYMINASKAQQESYLAFEDKLYNNMYSCTVSHNDAVSKVKSEIKLSDEEIESVHFVCSDALYYLQEINIENTNVPEAVSKVLVQTKENYKDVLSSIIMLNYVFDDEYDKAVSSVIQFNEVEGYKNLNKARFMLKLDNLNDEKEVIVDYFL